MVGCKNIWCQIVLEVTLNKIINPFSNTVNNPNIIEIDGWIGPMSMTIWIATKQMQKYNKVILVKKLLQVCIFIGPI